MEELENTIIEKFQKIVIDKDTIIKSEKYLEIGSLSG